jgi:oligopeptidase B
MIKFISKKLSHKTSQKIIGDNYTLLHGIYRYDGYNSIKNNKFEREEIIKRESIILKNWKTMFQFYYKQWESECFSKSLLPFEEIGEKFGNYTYYNKMAEEGYEILKRKAENIDEVVLDLKKIPFIKDINNTNLKGMRISKSHKYISFVVDLDNNEKYSGGIYDIYSNKFYWRRFENASMIEFSQDEASLIYVENNELNRPCRIRKHFLDWENVTKKTFLKNFSSSNDQILFEEKDSDIYIETSPTKDHNFLIINCLTKDDSEVSIMDLKSPDKITKILNRKKGIKYFIEHVGNTFYILSNLIVESKEMPEMKKNENFKLFTIKDDQLKYINKNLKLLVFPEKEEFFEDIDVFENYVAIYYKKDLQPYLLIHDVVSNTETRIKVGETQGEITPCLNKEFYTDKLRLEYTNPITYKSQYEFNLKLKNFQVLHESQINGLNKNEFVVESHEAPAKDGEWIPLTLFHRKDIKKNRKNKTILIGYGAYGLNLELSFDHVLMNAANMGWVVAFSHLRGGCERGKTWHDKGKMENKGMVIEDYLACAYYLIQQGYSHPNYLAGYGQSSGGAVVAQAINLRPDIFRAVVLSHPFLDILSTLLDDSQPLTITDYLEYGNPLKNQSIYDNIVSYSPYENLSNQEYPAMMITVSLDDPRVPSWGSLKYIQKLRTKAKDPTRIPNFIEKNICINIDQSGHFGPSNQNDALKNKIWEMTWLDKMLIDKDNILL